METLDPMAVLRAERAALRLARRERQRRENEKWLDTLKHVDRNRYVDAAIIFAALLVWLLLTVYFKFDHWDAVLPLLVIQLFVYVLRLEQRLNAASRLVERLMQKVPLDEDDEVSESSPLEPMRRVTPPC